MANLLKVLKLLVVFSLLAALPMADVLLSRDEVLAFNDGSIETNSSPVYRFPAALVRIWDNQFFFGNGAKQYWLSVHALNESLLGPHEARRLGVVLILAACGLAVYWSLRQFRVRPGAAAFAAGALMLSGLSFSFAVAGLYVRPVALAFSALALGFAERGRARDGWLDYVIAGGCLGLGVSEVPDVGAFFAITAAGVIAWRHIAAFGWSPRALLRLTARGALIGSTALLLGWQTVVNISATTIQGVAQGESKADRYAWATQWSIPPVETWDIVAGSHFGATMGDASLPYRGGIGSSEGWQQSHQGFRNFRMSAWYAGVIPSALLLALIPFAWRKRRDATPPGADDAPAHDRGLVILVLAGALVTLLLTWGKHFPLYKLVWSLPYFGTVRNPDKWNGPFMLFMTLGVAIALDWLLRALSAPRPAAAVAKPAKGRAVQAQLSPPLRPYLIAAAVLSGIALLMLAGTGMDRTGFVARLNAEGYGPASAKLWSHALWTSLKVLLLAGAFGGGVWWASRGNRRGAMVVLAGAALLTAADLVATGRFYAAGHAYQGLIAPNALTAFLDAHATEGRILVLPPNTDPRDPNRGQAAALAQALNQMRGTMLQIKGYDLFNPISVSRMPTDYESLFGAVGYMTPRMLELGSLRWIITVPGMAEALNQMDGGKGRFVERLALGLTVRDGGVIPLDEGPPEQRVLRVVEFTGALPKFQAVARAEIVGAGVDNERAALQQLARPDFDPRALMLAHSTEDASVTAAFGTATVQVVSETPASCEVRVRAEGDAVLVRSVKYDPDWKVSDGAQTFPVERVNYLFQGIRVPAGDHTLTLRYAPSLTGLYVAAAGRVALLLLVAATALAACRRVSA